MKILECLVVFLGLCFAAVSGYASAKEGKCPPLPSSVNCAAKLFGDNVPCFQDIECTGTEKCCNDGCGGYECKQALDLPVLPVVGPCAFNVSNLTLDDGQCKEKNVTYCSKDGCKECCTHTSTCSPLPGLYIRREECEKQLCAGKICPGQGEVCVMDKYHRAKCECPVECPEDFVGGEVCGSDNVTYKNECRMNMTACVLGDLINVEHQGKCGEENMAKRKTGDGKTTPNPLEICDLPKDPGHGDRLQLRYYFNKAHGICEGFLYHGNNGNKNNFKRAKDCHDHCFKAVKDVCILPKIVGPCRAAMSRWHFSKTSKKCEEFTYGGCHGNGNNFRSKDECENKCEAKKNANVCSLPKAEGICLGYFVRWYYDVKSKKCKTFVYGGCQGNANRFMTRKECDIACGAGTTGTRTLINKLVEGPFLAPKCYDPSKFMCRSIKKCIPASKKCNGKDDCGDNSDEENCGIDACRNVSCDFYSICVPQKNTNAVCQCPQICTADWNPVCGSDNETYPNLCMMKVQSCENQKIITKKSDGECGSRPKSKCEVERDSVSQFLIGAFIPKCEKDGSYSKIQCHGSTGSCWCVDEQGRKREETETRFSEPDCDKVVVQDPCDSVSCEFYSTCGLLKNGSAICECPQYCTLDWAPVCGSDNKTYPNLCAMQVESCEKKVMIRKQSDEECGSRKKSKCELERDSVPLLQVGAFIPTCEEDGSYSKTQCHESTGHCWCVDEQGTKLKETEVIFGRPDCDKAVKDPCRGVSCDFYAMCVPLRNGGTICECPLFCTRELSHVCGSNNKTYGNLCMMKVESCEKQKLITKRSDGKCGSRPRSKCELQRDSIPPQKVGAFIPECEKDGSYSKSQCHESTGYCWCVDEQGIKLEGTQVKFNKADCDKVSPPTTELFDICDISLCEFGKCVNVNGTATCQCNSVCPLIEQPVCGSNNKTYSNLCVLEVESCEQKQHITIIDDKPCGSRAKSKCERQRDSLPKPSPPGMFVPQCEEDGSYSKTQCHASTGYCWCVDEQGTKLKETEIRFSIPDCDKVTPPTPEPLDICEISLCEFGTCVNVNGTATCQCDAACPMIEQPVCGSNNKTYANLCVLEAESCERKQHITVIDDKPCGSRGKSKCEKERDSLPKPSPPGMFVPQCEEDGSYNKTQCHASTGYCWCVDEQGTKLEETEIRFSIPDCDKEITPVPSRKVDICMETLCELKSCVKIPGEEAKCECVKACSDDYQPVCGSDNKTHVNLCNLKLESCRTNKQIQVAYEGVCKVDLCAAVSCGFYSKCEVVDGSAKCVCDKACTEEFNPKCGSDGVMYTNPCELRRASCEQMKIIVATDGKCNSTINGNVRTGEKVKIVPSCSSCPTSGTGEVVKSFCSNVNKFVIRGQVVDVQGLYSKGKWRLQVSVKIAKRYKPRKKGKTILKHRDVVKITIVGISRQCNCDNLNFMKNENYVLMGTISTKNKLFIDVKKGFVQRVNPDLVKTLKKGFRRQARKWYFCHKIRQG